jgi:hypothetical protein
METHVFAYSLYKSIAYLGGVSVHDLHCESMKFPLLGHKV